ncbi:MAG: hypothetical protein ABSF67_20395 [Roseiarcus sp.]|jgi:hypothetical protein
MRACLAFVAAVIGAGLTIRGVADWGLGFFAAATVLIAWRARFSPLRRLELAIVALCAVAALFHPVDAALAAVVFVALLELMRIFR